MLGDEEELCGNLTGCSSRWQSDGCSRVARSGSREWMRWRIMRLPTPFIERRREGRRYHGGEMIDDEWSYLILPFRGEERNGQHPFRNGKGTCEEAPGSRAEGHRRMLRTWRCAIAAASWSQTTSGSI
jgi:hypothetical protein